MHKVRANLLIIIPGGHSMFNDDILLEYAGDSVWPYDRCCRLEYTETVLKALEADLTSVRRGV